ncbi:hypothetical protein D3C75_961400 [compost metagenome]
MDTARHQIVTRTLRGAFGQNRRFHFHKAVFIQIITEYLGRLGAQVQGALHFRTAQVQITVLQANLLIHLHTVFDEEGRRFGRVHNFDFRNPDLNFAGFQVGVFGVLAAFHHGAADCQYIFIPCPVGNRQRLAGEIRIEDHLDNAAAVTQINKQHAAQIPAALDPTVQGNFRSDISLGKQAALMGS